MSAPRAGPQLPPHLLAKRKRDAEAAAASSSSASAPSANSKAELPTTSCTSSPDSASKRRRVIGPALPPAPQDEMPHGTLNNDDQDSSSSEDEFGPSLPGQGISSQYARNPAITSIAGTEVTAKSRRDDWMTMPPKQDDLAARMDPTKVRAKGFNTGKSARGAGSEDNSAWTETPEQKRKRLEDQVLGIEQPGSRAGGKEVGRSKREIEADEEKARKIREHNEKHRSKTLYEQHQGSSTKEREDDPSKRAFDYEKDMAVASKIGHAQKKELLNNAANFGSRFSSGSYL